ncbi:hypothetical protein RB195_015126 [Necator americanus]|uniref:Nucleotide-diphospho-sugar transferase domain-containing protein n=1 Tax=Necator americanus TaxID=51031 RepID=A0ABR1E393_NECAM
MGSKLLRDLKGEQGPITHYYDGWHMINWLGNKLRRVNFGILPCPKSMDLVRFRSRIQGGTLECSGIWGHLELAVGDDRSRFRDNLEMGTVEVALVIRFKRSDQRAFDIFKTYPHQQRRTSFFAKSRNTAHTSSRTSVNPNISMAPNHCQRGWRVQEIVDYGKELSRRRALFIYVLIFNHGYRHIVSNWLCNTAHFTTVHERTLLVSISNGTCDEVLRHVKAKILCAYVSVGNYDAPVDFASYSFDAIMLFRAYLATAFAESSVKVVMIEADATWFRDPKHLFASEFSNEAVDIVAPRNGGISRGTIRAMSPMVIKPSNRTARFLKGLTRRLERLFDLSDQAVYNILCLSRYLGLRCGMFYYEDIADGVCHKYRFRDMMRPYIVNNNYIIGTLAKQERMEIFGLWFLDSDGRCNQTAVELILKMHNTPIYFDDPARLTSPE